MRICFRQTRFYLWEHRRDDKAGLPQGKGREENSHHRLTHQTAERQVVHVIDVTVHLPPSKVVDDVLVGWIGHDAPIERRRVEHLNQDHNTEDHKN